MTNEPDQEQGLPIDERLAERLSAYLDGELNDDERTEVEQRLATDPNACDFLEGLRSVSQLCHESEHSLAWQDLSGGVLAEVHRRNNLPDATPQVTRAESLEPEGEFGLPFGRSARGWAWAGLAVAAALMLGFFDRRPTDPPPRPIARGPSAIGTAPSGLTPVSLGLERMRRAVPGLRVVRLELTPKGKELFEQALAQRGLGIDRGTPGALPAELATARQSGVIVEPVTRADAENDLMFVSAEQPHVASLLADLEKDPSNFRVEADPPAQHQPEPTLKSPSTRTIRIHLRIVRPTPSPTHQGAAPPSATATASTRKPGGRVPVVFVLKTRAPQHLVPGP